MLKTYSNARTRIIIALNVLVQFTLFYFLSTFTNQVDFDGDQIDYHVIAVNYSKGHGFMMEGYFEDFGTYKFNANYHEVSDPSEKTRELKSRNFVRNPVFPFLVGTIYQVVGINPIYIKFLQLFLLCLTASLLIFIGSTIDQQRGKIVGFFAGWLLLIYTYTSASSLLTEPLLIFISVMLLYSLIRFYRNDKVVLIAVIISISLLAKGIFYFFALVFFAANLVRWIQKKQQIKSTLLVFLLSASMVSPYVIWQNSIPSSDPEIEFLRDLVQLSEKSEDSDAFLQKAMEFKDGVYSEKIKPYQEVILNNPISLVRFTLKDWLNDREKPIFIVNQGEEVLLASNNELCMDGDWHKEWNKNKDLYYHKIPSGISPSHKVASFYINKPQLILPIFCNKIHNGFLRNSSIVLFISVVFAYFAFENRRHRYMAFIALLGIIATLYLTQFSILNSYIQFAALIFTLLFMIRCLSFLSKNLWKEKSLYFYPFIISSFLMTLVFYGYFRIYSPFFIAFCYLLVDLIYRGGQSLAYKRNSEMFKRTGE